MRIMVVDDQILFREVLIGMLKDQPDMQVVGEAGSVEEAVRMAGLSRPDMILLDYSLPDGTGPQAAQKILAVQPEANIVFLTIHDADEYLFAAIRSGARGYLLKELPFVKLVAALRALEREEAALSRKMMLRVLGGFAQAEPPSGEDLPGLDLLSKREIQILEEVASGASNKDIADHLSLSVATVKNHIHRVLWKLKLKNRQDMARYVRQHTRAVAVLPHYRSGPTLGEAPAGRSRLYR